MSNKRREQDGALNLQPAAGPAGGKRSRRQKHLYLVLDDREKGLSIYKMDADSFDSGDQVAEHLPEPPTLRLESPAGHLAHAATSFSAMGTKIFALMNQRCCLVYDTEMAVLGVGAHAPHQMVCGFGISVAIDGVLYMLTYRSFDKQHPHRLPGHVPTEGWSWKALPSPPPTFCRYVNSYALHPDGCTIFMTTANFDTAGNPLGTCSFNTKESAWRWHGEWALPFLGRAHFDVELNAWVGLHSGGYIASCQVISPTYYNERAPTRFLDFQTTKEKLFCKDRERHMKVSLTYMEGTNKFCLIECGDDDGYVLHFTIFGLKHRFNFSPFAFWM
ncbi:hypothetical protein BS78_09G205500 [Paspalum vaginatum]|nr:hypothetical protein BS78_09G205500 [Paspalum vaginatum]